MTLPFPLLSRPACGAAGSASGATLAADGGDAGAAVLLDDDVVELLDRRLGGPLVGRDLAPPGQVDPVAGPEHGDGVVRDHGDRDPALPPQAGDQGPGQPAPP